MVDIYVFLQFWHIIVIHMSNQKITIIRLQKQQRSLQNQPIPNLLVKRDGLLNFHFCVYGLEGKFAGGFYHGVLELASDYPFSPPTLKFFTESGRFETNKPICTTFTNYHKEQWTSAWNVRTMLLGVISFMTSAEGGAGSLHESQAKVRLLAQKSLERNLQSPLFVRLFQQQLKNIGKSGHKTKVEQSTNINTIKIGIANKVEAAQPVQGSNCMYILIGVLLLLIMTYAIFRDSFSDSFNSQS